MSLHNVFPNIKLDSSPHTRPLAPWNPADYRTLVGWLFDDPHALDAYSDHFVTGQQKHAIPPPTVDIELQSRWTLLLMVVVLLAVIFAVAGLAAQFFASVFPISRADLVSNWVVSAILGELMLVMVFVIIGWWLERPATGALLGFFLGLILGGLQFYQLSFMLPTGDGFAWVGSSFSGFNFLTGTGAGLMLNNLIGVIRRGRYGPFVELVTKWLMGITIMLLIVIYNAGFSLGSTYEQSIGNTLLGIGSFLLGLIRPIDWLRGTFLYQHDPAEESNWDAPRVTLLSTPHIHQSLRFWLERNWERGLGNANQLWQHTNQRGPVLKAIRAELERQAKEPKGEVTEKVAGLIDPKKGYSWTLDDLLESHLVFPGLSSANLTHWWNGVRKQALPTRKLFSSQVSIRTVRPQPVAWHGIDLPTHGEVDASLAGFHYLRTRNLDRAITVFKKLTKSELAKEITDIAENLQKLLKDEAWLDKSEKFFKVEKKPEPPKKPKRGESWDTLAELKAILDEAWLYKRCSLQSPNRTVLRNSVNERLDKLRKQKFDFAEGEIMRALAEIWEKPLESWFDMNEDPLRSKSIKNPYKPGEPLPSTSSLLVGRKDQLDALERASSSANPILLYGQAGSGKTSLIDRIQKQGKNFWPTLTVNLRSRKQLMNLSLEVLHAIGQQLHNFSSIAAPNINTPNVLIQFQDLLFQVCKLDPARQVTIVIDQMELATTGSSEGRQDLRQLIGLLSNMPQQVKNLNVIFSGRLTPQEFSELGTGQESVPPIPLKMTLLDEKAVASLLNQPLEEIIARFQPDAVKYIHAVTGGQPYLIHLIADQVIKRFNEREKKKEEHPDPVFMLADVDAVSGFSVVDGESFLDREKMKELPFWKSFEEYYKSILDQASRRVPDVESLLLEFSKTPNGKTFADLAQGFGRQTRRTETMLQEQLQELAEMDLLKFDKESKLWKIAIDLVQIYASIKQ